MTAGDGATLVDVRARADRLFKKSRMAAATAAAQSKLARIAVAR